MRRSLTISSSAVLFLIKTLLLREWFLLMKRMAMLFILTVAAIFAIKKQQMAEQTGLLKSIFLENRVGGLLVFGMINGLQEIPQERESILLLPTRQGASISPINSWIRVMILSLLQRRFGRLH